MSKPVSVLDLAMFRGLVADPDGSVSMGEFERVGLPMMGGCYRCGATVAAYNAAPTRTGYLACLAGCAHDGYETAEDANRAMFPEEYVWGGLPKPCAACLGGVSDTCDACGERHCAACDPCYPDFPGET